MATTRLVVRATSGTQAREKTADQSITVMVTDEAEAPAAPSAPSVSAAGPTSLTVSWSEPSNSGPPITDYDYRYQVKSPEGPWTEVTTTTITELGATIEAACGKHGVQRAGAGQERRGQQRLVGVRAAAATDANAGPVFTSLATFERGGEPDRGGYGGGVGRRHRGQRDGVHDRGRRGRRSRFSIVSGTGVLTFKAAPNYEDEASDADTEQRLRGGGAGDQRRRRAGEDGGPVDHGDGDGRGRRGAGSAGRAGGDGGWADESDGDLERAVEQRAADHGLRPAVPGGGQRGLHAGRYGRVRAERDHRRSRGGHGVRGAGAGEQRRGRQRLVGFGQRRDGRRTRGRCSTRCRRSMRRRTRPRRVRWRRRTTTPRTA